MTAPLKSGGAFARLARVLGIMPERKVIPGPPVNLGPEGFKGLWDKVVGRFAELPQGDTGAELGGVWFKAVGTESGNRSENDWPSVQSAIDSRELSGTLASATVEYEQFTKSPTGASNRRVIYVRLYEDSISELEVIGPHDWKVATVADLRNYLRSYKGVATQRRAILIASAYVVLLAAFIRLIAPGVSAVGGWSDVLVLSGIAALFCTVPVAWLASSRVSLSRLYIDDRTEREPAWYRALGAITVAVASSIVAALIVTYFLGTH
ncbi:MAG: hypothetical protein ACLQD9_04330 [Thermoplasmata archaeon]